MRMLSHLITKRGIAFVKRRYDSPAAAVTHWEHFGMEPIVVGHGFTFRPPYVFARTDSHLLWRLVSNFVIW